MTDNLQFVKLSERVYKYIRQYAIKSTEDALVELITNSIDAYNKGGITPRNIDIEYRAPNKLIIIDNAIGLTSEELTKNFLQVGEYTNIESSRGFFSRGAKDISAIGNVTFQTIKDGKYSMCYLNSEAYGTVYISDIDATQEKREELSILGNNNGLHVTLELLDSFIIHDPRKESANIRLLAVLRDIMNDKDNNITFAHYHATGNLVFKDTLRYDYPPSTEVLRMQYTVPDYPDATAEFVINRSHRAFDQPIQENKIEFGFLIKSSATIYESSMIENRFRWSPHVNLIYGYLKCDYIAKLLLDYDKGEQNEKNPSPIIDPSRVNGLNEDHPFVERLLRIPKLRLDKMLRDLNQEVSRSSITLNEVNQLLDELANYGVNILETEEIKVTFIPSYDEELFKAIQDDRAQYVNTEVSYAITDNYEVELTDIDNKVKEYLLKLDITTAENGLFVTPDSNPNDIFQLDKNKDEINDNTNYLDLVKNNDVEVKKNPYIYGLSDTGKLMKLYIFEKGTLESLEDESGNVLMKNRKFRITFMDDINFSERYLIDYSDGIEIKLNLHNKSVKRYLKDDASRDLDSSLSSSEISVNTISQTKSLVFLQELMVDAMAQIILDNDIQNNNLILDSTPYNNTKKLITHRNKLIS